MFLPHGKLAWTDIDRVGEAVSRVSSSRNERAVRKPAGELTVLDADQKQCHSVTVSFKVFPPETGDRT